MDANNIETITMMIKLVRIGKDAELRSANGKPVLSLSKQTKVAKCGLFIE